MVGNPRPRFCHHVGHGISPALIMIGIPVFGDVVFSLVNFNQDETIGISRLLIKIEPDHTWLFGTVTGIIEGSSYERVYHLRLDIDVDYCHDHEHPSQKDIFDSVMVIIIINVNIRS
jgi:hypothetical protein